MKIVHYHDLTKHFVSSVHTGGRVCPGGYIGCCRRLEGGQGVPLELLDGPSEVARARATPYEATTGDVMARGA